MSFIDKIKMPAAFVAGGAAVAGAAYLMHNASKPAKTGQDEKAPALDTERAVGNVQETIDLLLAERVDSFRIFTAYDPAHGGWEEPEHKPLWPLVNVMLQLVGKEDAEAKQVLGRMLDWSERFQANPEVGFGQVTGDIAGDYLRAHQFLLEEFAIDGQRITYQGLTCDVQWPEYVFQADSIIGQAVRVVEVRQKIATLREQELPQLYTDILNRIEQEQCGSWFPEVSYLWSDRLNQRDSEAVLERRQELREALFAVVDRAHDNRTGPTADFAMQAAFCVDYFRVEARRRYPPLVNRALFRFDQATPAPTTYFLHCDTIGSGFPPIVNADQYTWTADNIQEMSLTEVMDQWRGLMKRFLLDRLDEEDMELNGTSYGWSDCFSVEEKVLIRGLLDSATWDDAAVAHLVHLLGSRHRTLNSHQHDARLFALVCVLAEQGVLVDEMSPRMFRLLEHVSWPTTAENLRELVANEHN